MAWIYDAPIWFIELAAMALAVLVGVGVHILVQRAVPYSRLLKHNDVAGFLFSMIGVIYAVVLGFVVIVVWEKYDTAVANALAEESALSDIYRIVSALPEPFEKTVRVQIREYGQLMVQKEWPAMRASTESKEAQLKGEQIAFALENFHPANAGQSNIHQASISLEQKFLDARRERLRENEGTVLPILWWTLILGALATVGFTYFFGTENQRMQLTMTGVVAVLLATMFVLIIEFDRPFSGSISVPPSIWTTFLDQRLPQIR